MAKDQSLSLNPTKISGLCGRLMCCLKFEHDNYESMREELPQVGKMVITSLGEGKVVGVNAGHRTVHVQLFEISKVKELPMDDVVVK
jgi:cell fate regulator YaaT (PSP1 superfamily)